MTKPYRRAFTITCLSLLLANGACRSRTETAHSRHPSPLPDIQGQEVIRVLDQTEGLDKIMRAGQPGQDFATPPLKAYDEYQRVRQTLPQYKTTLGSDAFGEIMDYYFRARLMIEGKMKYPLSSPLEMAAEARLRKVMLRRLLKGIGTQNDWKGLKMAVATGQQYQ